ncbi:MAG: hypothetical protein AB7O38_25900 [Pirellulaceae bacterium]
MKSSRFRGAALASLAVIASGSVHAQMAFPPASPPYASAPAPAAGYGYGPAVAPNYMPMTSPVAAPQWTTRPVAFGAASLIPEPSVSLLGNTQPVGTPAAMAANSPSDISAPQGYGQPAPCPPGQQAGAYGYPQPGSAVADPQYPGALPYGPGQAPAAGHQGMTPGYAPGGAAGAEFSHGAAGMGGAYGGAVQGSGAYGGGAYASGSTCSGSVHGGGGMGATSAVCTAGSGYYDTGFTPPGAVRGGGGCWYLGMYSLILSRSGQNHFTYSFDTGNEAIQYTDAKDTEIENEFGFAVSGGWLFNCGLNAIEVVYWGWFPDDAAVYTYGANAIGDLNGIWNWDSLTYNGANAGQWVNDANVHALFRSNEAHNIELNLIQVGNAQSAAYYSPWRYSLLAGVRYFRFHDHLIFASDTTDNVIDGDVTEISYDVKTVNNLIGFQVGGVGTYQMSQRFAFNAGTKFGLYGNNIEHTSRIGGAAGTAVINNGPNNGVAWVVDNNKETVSFLGELFLGGTYCMGSSWSASAGYRAVAVTGMGLPTDQIYPDLRGINDAATIESNGSLLLHGAYIGAQFCF